MDTGADSVKTPVRESRGIVTTVAGIAAIRGNEEKVEAETCRQVALQ